MLVKFFARSAFVALAVAAVAPAHAQDAGKQRFSHEGFTYVYDVKETASGKVITGKRYPGAEPFTLTVRGNGVAGVSGGQHVAFNLSEAKGAAQGAVIEAAN